MLRYTVLLRKNTQVSGYSVLVPELPGCFSQGATLEEALSNAKEAIECHLEAMIQDGEDIPVEKEPFVIASVPAKVAIKPTIERGKRKVT